MKAAQMYLLLHFFLTAAVLVNALDPVSAGVGIFSKLWQYFRDKRSPPKGCSKSISFNAEGLRTDLENELFGQHIASRIILNAVTGFMSDDDPKKPLVLSLHGPSGTGKNFINEMIADNIYKEGMKSQFVHLFISTLHFPHKSHIDSYKAQLQQWIQGNISSCERSMFIFDEMDKMQPGLIDSIKPYLDYYNNLQGVSYRKAIFIFLSNAGSENITATALSFWKEGRSRDEIKLKDLEDSVSASAFNGKNGFHRSDLIDENLVDFFVPFLPLEYKHVLQCAMAAMKAKGLRPDQDVAEEVAKDLVYFPKPESVFSSSGCKKVANRVYEYLMLLSPPEDTVH